MNKNWRYILVKKAQNNQQNKELYVQCLRWSGCAKYSDDNLNAAVANAHMAMFDGWLFKDSQELQEKR